MSLFLTPYIIDKIGVTAYGVWILVGSFSGYFGLFDFGIGFAVVRYVARYQETGEVEKRNEVISAAFYIASFLAAVVAVVVLVVIIKAPAWFDLPPEMIISARVVIGLVGFAVAVGFPLSIFSRALAGGLYRFDLFNKVSLIMGASQVMLTVFLLELDYGLYGLGLAAFFGSTIGYLWRLKILIKLIPDLKVRFQYLTRPILRKIGGYSIYSFILVLSGRVAFYSDSFIVGYLLGLEEVAIFGLAAKLVEYLRQLTFTVTNLFSPIASRYDPDLDKKSLKRIFYDGSRLNLLFSLPISLIMFFWGSVLIKLWIGPESSSSFSASGLILQVLLAGHILSFVQSVGGEIMLGVGRHRVYSIVSLGSALLNILLSIVLVKKIGLIGVAWGTTIPLTLLSLGYLPWATLKLVDGRPLEFIRQAIIRPALVALLPGVMVYAGRDYIDGLAALLYGSLAVALVYAIIAYFIGLRRSERERIRVELARVWRNFY